MKELNINYIHYLDLAPTNEIRKLQKDHDLKDKITKKDRANLCDKFINEYKSKILNKFDFNSFFVGLDNLKSNNVLFFCVEREYNACHRSIVTEYISKNFGMEVIHLIK